LESILRETGDDGEIIYEKLWDKDNEENPNNVKEKYESGPSVKDTDSSGIELKAKEDSDSVTLTDEVGELNPNELDKQEVENENQDDLDNSENEGADTMEDDSLEELDESDENKNGEEEKHESLDEGLEEAETEQPGGNTEGDDVGNTNKEATEMDLVMEKKVASTRSFIISENPPNPCRNVGDALEEWKERVKVTVDLWENNKESLDDILDEDPDEYGYVAEFDKGTTQALGSTTSE
ncbi:Midasin, partial [Camellia lanceoleosa]